MKARPDPYITYGNAAGVAGLWVTAVVIPFFLVPAPRTTISTSNMIALGIVLVAITLIRSDLKRLEKRRRLNTSDRVAYVVIPVILFVSSLAFAIRGSYA